MHSISDKKIRTTGTCNFNVSDDKMSTEVEEKV